MEKWTPPDSLDLSMSASRNVSPNEDEGVAGVWTYLLATPERKAAGDLVEAHMGTLASLVAAVYLLEKDGKSAMPSDKMFEKLLSDFHKAIAESRAALAKAQPDGGENA